MYEMTTSNAKGLISAFDLLFIILQHLNKDIYWYSNAESPSI